MTFASGVFGEAPSATGQAPTVSAFADSNETTGNLNLEHSTLGGKQFWTDQQIQGGWRIQRNVVTAHSRLLDHSDRRRAWGSLQACETAFARHLQAGEIPQDRSRVVIVLHGLGRSRSSMQPMCDYLQEHGDFTAINVTYASTRETVAEHARSLRRIVEHLGPKIQEVNFVAHSLGNIVIRHYLHDITDPVNQELQDDRIGRIVMLGPPNNGSLLAERFRNNLIFQALWGKSGLEIAKDFQTLQQHLATPPCPFAIIAGGNHDPDGINPLLEGDNDFVVTVEETRLPGAADFLVVPVLHSFLMNDVQVQRQTLAFLRDGHFARP